jgi:hypothetical protein
VQSVPTLRLGNFLKTFPSSGGQIAPPDGWKVPREHISENSTDFFVSSSHFAKTDKIHQVEFLKRNSAS